MRFFALLRAKQKKALRHLVVCLVCSAQWPTFADHLDNPEAPPEAHTQRLGSACGPMEELPEDESVAYPKAELHHCYVIDTHGAQLFATTGKEGRLLCPELRAGEGLPGGLLLHPMALCASPPC
jgi:hypothetical protein